MARIPQPARHQDASCIIVYSIPTSLNLQTLKVHFHLYSKYALHIAINEPPFPFSYHHNGSPQSNKSAHKTSYSSYYLEAHINVSVPIITFTMPRLRNACTFCNPRCDLGSRTDCN